MKSKFTRREVAHWILAASMRASITAKLRASTLAAGSGPDFKGMRSHVGDAISAGDATGVAVAVIAGGRIVWEEGFGWANREAKSKSTPNTPFSMASITKPFTTTTLMTLVAEGKISLDEPANNYLANSKITGSNGAPGKATIRMLGAHISGLPGMYESYETSEANLIPSPDILLRRFGRLAYPPGSCYEYSNIGYAALNAVAFALTKTPFGELMGHKILAPLGLNDSFFGSDFSRVKRGAVRYDPLGHPIPHYNTSTPASGELYASAHDLASFLLFNMRKDDSGSASILSQRHKSALHEKVFTGPSGIASTFGWFQGETTSGVPFLFKSGGDPGVANRVCFVPSMGLGCVALTNQSNAWKLAYAICDMVMRSFLPEWRRPEEYCGFPPTPLKTENVFQGKWRGTLENDGCDISVSLDFRSAGATTLTIGGGQEQQITEIRADGNALTGATTGLINSADAMKTHATTLEIKLVPHGDRLIGRVFAVAGDPNVKNVRLPYVLSLARDNG